MKVVDSVCCNYQYNCCETFTHPRKFLVVKKPSYFWWFNTLEVHSLQQIGRKKSVSIKPRKQLQVNAGFHKSNNSINLPPRARSDAIDSSAPSPHRGSTNKKNYISKRCVTNVLVNSLTFFPSQLGALMLTELLMSMLMEWVSRESL